MLEPTEASKHRHVVQASVKKFDLHIKIHPNENRVFATHTHHIHLIYSQHNLKMSLAGPLPLKAVAPIRAIRCQRRCISQSTRPQSNRPSIPARTQRQKAPSIRVRPTSHPFHSINILTYCTALPCLPTHLRPPRSLQNPRRRQIRLGRRHQESLLRPRKEIPPGHQQRSHGKRPIRRRPIRLRSPLRRRKEESIRFLRRRGV